ncbi:hypothetical protein FDJ70_10365, partial [Clostridium botulinum]|nr:hypothetical protein [Clostridium botulinum]
MNKTYIVLNCGLTKTTYYIAFNFTTDSKIKAKNAIFKEVLNDLNINFKNSLLKDKETVKHLKNNCCEELSNTFKTTTKYTTKEIKADISKVATKKENGFIILADGSKKEVQGNKFKTSLLENADIELLLIKLNNYYEIIDKKSGLKICGTKYKKDIEEVFATTIKDMTTDAYKEKVNTILNKAGLDSVYTTNTTTEATIHPINNTYNNT